MQVSLEYAEISMANLVLLSVREPRSTVYKSVLTLLILQRRPGYFTRKVNCILYTVMIVYIYSTTRQSIFFLDYFLSFVPLSLCVCVHK